MSASTRETIARGAVLASRRAALLALAGGTTAAMAAQPVAGTRRKTRRKGKKKSADKCKRQVQQCRTLLTDACAADGCDGLLDTALACCQPLSRCDAGESITCLFAL